MEEFKSETHHDLAWLDGARFSITLAGESNMALRCRIVATTLHVDNHCMRETRSKARSPRGASRFNR